MTIHRLSMIERKPGAPHVPNPTECKKHHDAGRVPVYYEGRLVAYVDRPGDLPEAKFVKRDGRLVGEVGRWS